MVPSGQSVGQRLWDFLLQSGRCRYVKESDFTVKMTPCTYSPQGYDAPFHLAEECSNSNIASPRAIVMTAQFGLYMGWAIILVIVYTVQDITDVVAGEYVSHDLIPRELQGRQC